MTPADGRNLLDLLMEMEADQVEPETLGELVDWLTRRRAKVERAQCKTNMRLMELGTWWQTVRALYANLGRDVSVSTLLELIDDEARQ